MNPKDTIVQNDDEITDWEKIMEDDPLFLAQAIKLCISNLNSGVSLDPSFKDKIKPTIKVYE